MEGHTDGVTLRDLKIELVCLAPKKGENWKGGLSLIAKILSHRWLFAIYLLPHQVTIYRKLTKLSWGYNFLCCSCSWLLEWGEWKEIRNPRGQRGWQTEDYVQHNFFIIAKTLFCSQGNRMFFYLCLPFTFFWKYYLFTGISSHSLCSPQCGRKQWITWSSLVQLLRSHLGKSLINRQLT